MPPDTATMDTGVDDAAHLGGEYLEFLRCKMEKAMASVHEGGGRSNEEVKAAFAAKHARPLAELS